MLYIILALIFFGLIRDGPELTWTWLAVERPGPEMGYHLALQVTRLPDTDHAMSCGDMKPRGGRDTRPG